MNEYVVLLYYKFVTVEDPEQLRDSQRALCQNLGIKGRILVGHEGINGTVEGTRESIDAYKNATWEDERFADMVFKESVGTGKAFGKLKVKVRDEILAMGGIKVDPQTQTAPTITAEQLNDWYANDEDFVVLDLRNSFEIQSGHFERTVDPGLRNFRDLPGKLDDLARDPRLKDKKVLTVCNGDIRCEKATCIMQDHFSDLYHLEDGIHVYMQKYPNKHYKGTLFVFDDRVTDDLGAGPEHEIVGRCEYCEAPTEHYANNDSVTPSEKILCCEACFEENKDALRAFVATDIK